MSDVPPLIADFTPGARQELADLTQWLKDQSEDLADRFLAIAQDAISQRCQHIADEIAVGGRPAFLPDEMASLAFSRPAYTTIFTTRRKRSRQSASGTYRIIYTLLDANKDGKVDTLSVLSVRHAAAQPLWQTNTEE